MKESILDQMATLKHQLDEVRKCGVKGKSLATRVEDDLSRTMNSAWLNCADLIDVHEKKKELELENAQLKQVIISEPL